MGVDVRWWLNYINNSEILFTWNMTVLWLQLLQKLYLKKRRWYTPIIIWNILKFNKTLFILYTIFLLYFCSSFNDLLIKFVCIMWLGNMLWVYSRSMCVCVYVIHFRCLILRKIFYKCNKIDLYFCILIFLIRNYSFYNLNINIKKKV